MTEERRATIEAAMDALETEEDQSPTVSEPVQEELDLGTPEPVVEETQEEVQEVKPEEPTEKVIAKSTPTGEKAPQSWKPSTKAKWDKLDPEVRQEVVRREKQTTQVLNESAQARQISTQLQQAVQPYMARLNSLNAHPITVVGNLLKSDHVLSQGTKAAKAQLMAKLITDYDIDLVTLDTVLAGKPVADPVATQVEQIVQQRLAQSLAPYQQLLVQQQQAEQAEQQRLASTVNSMATNPKYPYFEQVRGEMADIIELSTKRGIPLSIEEAYNKAIQLDPVISKEVAAKVGHGKASAANQQAQRALRASSSVSGAPSGGLLGSPTGNDRRATIAAAFESLGGR